MRSRNSGTGWGTRCFLLFNREIRTHWQLEEQGEQIKDRSGRKRPAGFEMAIEAYSHWRRNSCGGGPGRHGGARS